MIKLTFHGSRLIFRKYNINIQNQSSIINQVVIEKSFLHWNRFSISND